MEKLSGPYAYSAHDIGYGGWTHWKTSGASFYSYPTTPARHKTQIFSVIEGENLNLDKKHLVSSDLVDFL